MAPEVDYLLSQLAGLGKVDCYRDVTELAQGLRAPLCDPTMGLFLVRGRQDLKELAAMNGALQDIKLFLVLPSSDPALVTLGHGLGPRFLTNENADREEIIGVLQKMLASGSRGFAGSPATRALEKTTPPPCQAGLVTGESKNGKA